VNDNVKELLSINGTRTVDEIHRELGKVVWDYVGMTRNKEGLEKAIGMIRALREEFWKNVRVVGIGEGLNESLEKAGRVADFLELAELMAIDALHRDESCGGHFRIEHQTPDGEAKRDDEQFAYVAAWEYQGDDQPPRLRKEELRFEFVKPTQRVYK
jgi:succinate dehydrogenase / fumarate reductase flavoprotein subunit